MTADAPPLTAARRPPVDLAGVAPVMGPLPAPGEHTDAILRGRGRGGRLEDLRSAASPDPHHPHNEPENRTWAC